MANRDQKAGGEPPAAKRKQGGGDPWRGQARYGARYDEELTSVQDQSNDSGPPTLSERDPAWRGDEREPDDEG